MDDVPNGLRMSLGVAVLAGESGGSYGTIVLDNLLSVRVMKVNVAFG